MSRKVRGEGPNDGPRREFCKSVERFLFAQSKYTNLYKFRARDHLHSHGPIIVF